METASEMGKSMLRWASSTLTDTRYKVEGLYGSEIERKVKEATSNATWGCSGTLKNEISAATFDFSESYDQIMAILWERIDASAWRVVYKTLTLMEHLIRSGSKRVVDECRMQIYRIRLLNNFYSIDEEGVDRGKSIRMLAKKVCRMLDDNRILRKAREETALQGERMKNLSGPSYNSTKTNSLSYDQLNRSSFDSRPSFAENEWGKSFGSEHKSKERSPSPEKERRGGDEAKMEKPRTFNQIGKKPKTPFVAEKPKNDEENSLIDLDNLDNLVSLPESHQIVGVDGIAEDAIGDVNEKAPDETDLASSFDLLDLGQNPKIPPTPESKAIKEDEFGISDFKSPPLIGKGERSPPKKKDGGDSAKKKIEKFIPGSSLVDLDALTKVRRKDFRSKEKMKMNQM